MTTHLSLNHGIPIQRKKLQKVTKWEMKAETPTTNHQKEIAESPPYKDKKRWKNVDPNLIDLQLLGLYKV
ncbi:hypothetical protein Tco_1450323 [Tanacetum coccineum]